MRFDRSPQWDDLGQYVPPDEDPLVSLPRRALIELWEILCALTAAVVAYLKVAVVFALLAAALVAAGALLADGTNGGGELPEHGGACHRLDDTGCEP